MAGSFAEVRDEDTVVAAVHVFHLPGKHNQKAHAQRRSAGRTEGKDLLKKDKTAAEVQGRANARFYDTTNGHGPLASVAADQGFDGPPQTVTAAEMDGLVANGSRPMYRAVVGADGKSSGDIQEQLRSGPVYYTPDGVSGNGIYFASDGGLASLYKDDHPDSMVRATLHPKARTITSTKLAAEQSKWGENRTSAEMGVFSEPGTFAAAKGYDAIIVEGGLGGEVVVLNRTALIVQEAP